MVVSGSSECCGHALDSQPLEHPEEVWATLMKKEPVVLRELMLDFWAQYSLAGREGVYHVRFAHDGSDVLWHVF